MEQTGKAKRDFHDDGIPNVPFLPKLSLLLAHRRAAGVS